MCSPRSCGASIIASVAITIGYSTPILAAGGTPISLPTSPTAAPPDRPGRPGSLDTSGAGVEWSADTATSLDLERRPGSSTLILDLVPVRKPPILDTTPFETLEDTPATFQLRAQEREGGDVLAFQIVDVPGSGTLYQVDENGQPRLDEPITPSTFVTNSEGFIHYVPSLDYFGTVSMRVDVFDRVGWGGLFPPIPIHILPVNDRPILDTTPFTTIEDTPATFQLRAYDPDVGDTLSFQFVVTPVIGTLYQVDADGTPLLDQPIAPGTFVSNADGLIHYVPRQDFAGTVLIRVHVFDQEGWAGFFPSFPIHVIGVNDPPIALPATYSAPNNRGPVMHSIALHATDVDTAQESLQICITGLPAIGELRTWHGVPVTQTPFCTTERYFQYRYPDPADLGLGCDIPPADLPSHFPLDAATITFHAFDGEDVSPSAQVNVQFLYANTPPHSTSLTAYTLDEYGSVEFTLTGEDIDGDLFYFLLNGPPTQGTVLLNGQPLGYPILVPNNTTLTFVPPPHVNTDGGPPITFSFGVSDGDERDCAYAVEFTVNPVNSAPTLSEPEMIDTDGVTYAQYMAITISDDAAPGTLLLVDVIGTGVPSLGMVNPGGLASYEQLTPTHVRMSGTLAALNAALGPGIWVSMDPDGVPPGATVELIVDDQGNTGAGKPQSGSLVIPVESIPCPAC